MIKLHAKTHFHEYAYRVDGFNPHKMTWIVADLPTKSKIQNLLLKKDPCLPEDSVLRISELWQKCLSRLEPECDIVSLPFLHVCIAEWLEKRNLDWARHPNTAKIVIEYISVLLPALIDPQARSLLSDWLRTQPDSFLRWGQWFSLACEVWDYFSEQKILASTWVVGYLSQFENIGEVWPRDIWLTVGPDITGLEAELLQKISRVRDVDVYQPGPEWTNAHRSLFWPYQIFSDPNFKHQDGDSPSAATQVTSANVTIECRRFASALAEVKEATALCRQWLQAGVLPSEIAIVTHKIEDYWPALSRYFEIEGLPVDKDRVASGQAFPLLTRWLARIKVESREIDSHHIEAVHFDDKQKAVMSYESFRQLFSRIYDENDLQRDEKIRSLFQLDVDPRAPMGRDQFFVWALQFWREDTREIEGLFAQLLQECSAHVQLSLRSWVAYISTLLAKIEIKEQLALPTGIQCLNFDATLGLEIKKVIFLNLSDASMQEDSLVAVTQADVMRLSNDLGLHLPLPHRQPNLFYAERLLASGLTGAYLFFSAADFQGQILAPSLLWLDKSLRSGADLETVHAPQAARWDELQLNPDQISAWDHLTFDADRGLAVPPQLSQVPELRFSPTQIKKFIDCPFVFLTEKIFHLSDLPDVDLDLDAMTNGRIQHALLENLMTEPFKSKWSQSELVKLIDDIRIRLGLVVADERLWPAQRASYLKLAERFLQFEATWRTTYPQTLTVGKELRVKGQLDLSTESAGPGNLVPVSGQIDRVDTRRDTGGRPQYVVLDYKASLGNLSQHTSWLKKDEWQLLFYAMVIEQGLTSLPPGDVVAGFYFTLAQMEREKGFRLADSDGALFATKTRNKSPITAEGLLDLKKSFKKRWAEIVEKIRHGEFAPQPVDLTECYNCHWNTVCRAPHLN